MLFVVSASITVSDECPSKSATIYTYMCNNPMVGLQLIIVHFSDGPCKFYTRVDNTLCIPDDYQRLFLTTSTWYHVFKNRKQTSELRIIVLFYKCGDAGNSYVYFSNANGISEKVILPPSGLFAFGIEEGFMHFKS